MNWEENMYECEVWRDVMMVTMMMWQCDGDDDNDYGDDYINWDGDDCNYDQDIELVAAVDFPTFFFQHLFSRLSVQFLKVGVEI